MLIKYPVKIKEPMQYVQKILIYLLSCHSLVLKNNDFSVSTNASVIKRLTVFFDLMTIKSSVFWKKGGLAYDDPNLLFYCGIGLKATYPITVKT